MDKIDKKECFGNYIVKARSNTTSTFNKEPIIKKVPNRNYCNALIKKDCSKCNFKRSLEDVLMEYRKYGFPSY